MSDEKKDAPIVVQDFLGGVNKVVDIGDIRVARGFSRRAYTGCHHKYIHYDKTERRVWCKDCERDIEAFDAFELLVAQFYDAKSHYEKMQGQADEAVNHTIHLIACKNLEHVWRGKMVPACPHCKEGLFAEDFRTIGTRYSKELALQARINKEKQRTKGSS